MAKRVSLLDRPYHPGLSNLMRLEKFREETLGNDKNVTTNEAVEEPAAPAQIRGELAVPEATEEWAADDLPFEIEPPSKDFAVTDFRSAHWLTSRIIQARMYSKRVGDWAALQQKAAARVEENLMRRFGAQLQELTEQTLADTKKQSINLPNARVQLRDLPDTVEVHDADMLWLWARKNIPKATKARMVLDCDGLTPKQLASLGAVLKEHGVTFTEERTTDKRLVNSHVKSTGEIPDGCDVKPGERKMYIQNTD